MKALLFNVARHTQNFDAMRHFYQDVLGFEPFIEWNRGPDDRGVYLSPGIEGASIEILTMGASSSPPPGENITFSLRVEDVQAWYDRLSAAGVKIARGLEDAPWGHRAFGIDDPDGMRVWIYQVIDV